VITRDGGEVIDEEKMRPAAPSRGPGAGLDARRLGLENERLQAEFQATLQDMAKMKEELKQLQTRLAEGVRQQGGDRMTQLREQNAQLRKSLEQARVEVEMLKAEKARLEKQLEQLPQKPK
jgi:predicted RNase H-like nuclease (RuvC/YqgF family)